MWLLPQNVVRFAIGALLINLMGGASEAWSQGAAVGNPVRAQGFYQIQCWQAGELIIDEQTEQDVQFFPGDGRTMVSVKDKEGRQKVTISVVGDSLCKITDLK